jgi:hypothetical protein
MPALAGDHVQVLVNGYELTGDSQRVMMNDLRDVYDVTAFGDDVHNVIPGLRASSIAHEGYMNAAAARSHPVMKGVDVDSVISVLLGQNAAPLVGDPAYSLVSLQGRYATMPEVNRHIPFMALFANKGSSSGLWGVTLAPPTSFTNTTNGTAVDNGAASSNGGVGALHVLQAAASDTYSITIEGSTTGAFGGEQTTLLTFTLNGAALNSQRLPIAGTIPRYTRWRAVRTGSAGNTVRLSITLARF